MIKTENVSELIKLKDRNGLYKLFRKKWELWVAEEPNLEIMQFHLADGTSFLRMHKPKYFGDKLSDIRPMIKEINSTYKNFAGDVYPRLAVKIFNLEEENDLQLFLKGDSKEVTIPGSDQKIKYDPMARIGVGLSKIGTSKAVAIGAYAFALHELDAHQAKASK